MLPYPFIHNSIQVSDFLIYSQDSGMKITLENVLQSALLSVRDIGHCSLKVFREWAKSPLL